MMNKKRLLALLLAVVMVIGMIPTVWATDGDDDHIKLNKTVSQGTDSDYLLTLEAFVEGEASIISKTKPADIVLVLDQSASMYAPMGAPGGRNNKTLYDPEALGHKNVKQYSEAQFQAMYNEDPETFIKNASHLGYYVAQSNAGGTTYCSKKYTDKNHKCFTAAENPETNTEDCRNYDWFIIQYEKGDAKPWKMYRVSQTANPSHDSKVPKKDGDGFVESREPEIVNGGFATFEEMLNCSGFNFYKSQYGALYDAISVFGQGIVDANVGHRLAVASFSAEIEYQKYATGSGLYIGSTYHRYNNRQYYTKESRYGFTNWQSVYDANTLTAAQYKAALTDNGASIMAAINAVESDSYGTNHDVGLDIANKIFAQNPVDLEKRDRIIIMFTDGQPSPVNMEAYTNGYASDTAGMTDAFLDQASIAKNTHKAQIYTIWTSTLSDDKSAFMRYGSSDYPDAKSMSNIGSPIEELKYASGVKTGNQLMETFGKVFEDVSSTDVTQLGKETIVRDVIAPSFTLPADFVAAMEATSKDETELNTLIGKYVKVYESKYKGNGVFAKSGEEGYTEFTDAKITVTKDVNTGLYQVDVTNYDFSKNYVTDLELGGCVGAKLVMQIAIDAKPDFLGGDDVVTNTGASAVYLNQEVVKEFPVPDVDVKVSNIMPDEQHKDIYISQYAELPSLANIGKFSLNGSNYQVDGINNAYVNIIYTIQKMNGDVPEGEAIQYTIPAGTPYESLTDQGWNDGAITHPCLTDDSTYNVTIQVVSTNNNTNQSSNDKYSNINVYKPVITFQDQSINLGLTPDYAEDFVQIAWQNKDGVSANTSVMGSAPVVEYGYDPVADKFTSDTDVRVTVTAEGGKNNVPADMDITQYTTFWRTACNVEGCDHNVTNVVGQDGVNFKIHINKFDLTIIKKIFDNSNPDQSFMFRVTKDDDRTYVMEVVIPESAFNSGEASITIKDLIPGDYTVEELVDWSWRYTCDDAEEKVPATSVQNGKTSVTFTNKRTNGKWLSGDSWAKNLWNAENSNVQRIN